MTRDEAFDKLVNASDEWTQAQQVVLNQIFDDFKLELTDAYCEGMRKAIQIQADKE